MANDGTDRVEGVDFTEILPLLEAIQYPITAEDFVAQYGDRTIDRTNADPITVGELFEPLGPDTFAEAEEVRQSILTLMPKDSVGLQRYSDRGLTIDVPDYEGRLDRPVPGRDEKPSSEGTVQDTDPD